MTPYRKTAIRILNSGLRKLKRFYINGVYGLVTLPEAYMLGFHFNIEVSNHLINSINEGKIHSRTLYLNIGEEEASKFEPHKYYTSCIIGPNQIIW